MRVGGVIIEVMNSESISGAGVVGVVAVLASPMSVLLDRVGYFVPVSGVVHCSVSPSSNGMNSG